MVIDDREISFRIINTKGMDTTTIQAITIMGQVLTLTPMQTIIIPIP
jgi:hypothetical protein